MSNAFGTRRKFWFEYDAYADGFDKDMLARLNTNIDVLLIFAGLFSAMNTAFIVVALTALSANPANETNHLLRLIVLNVSNHTLTENDLTPAFVPGPAAVRQNCTFFASLCCSLLAATGAVLAKQWLQFYERTRQAGPMEQQAVWRTEKFVGAEKWGLRPVVETLATLLLISLGLFFVALIDYLWSVNKTVAVVVLSFAAAGGLLYLIMVVLAAIFPACPFQTGPSAALRRLPRASIRSVDTIINIFNNLQDRIRAAVRPHFLNLKSHSTSVVIRSALFVVLFVVLATVVMFVISLFSLAGAILFLVAAIPILILGVLGIVLWLWFLSPLIEPLNIDSLHAHSAIIMAESASNAETITTVADNIPLISDFKAVRLIARSTAFETLLFHLQKSFQDFQGGNNEIDLTSTLSLARAVAHTMLADPKHTTKALEKCLRDLDRLGKGRSGSMPLELHILLSCIRTMCGLGATRIQAIDRQSMEIREIVQLAIENGSPFQEIVQLAIENGGPFQVIIDWLAPSPAFALLRPAFTLRENWWTRRPIPTAKVILPSPTATLWLHHCTVIAAYNRWDEGVMEGLVQDLSDQFLFEGLKPDTTYLSRVMDALLAILRWYPLWGARNGHPSLDDKANVQSAWTVPRNRPLITQLLDTLDEFSRHYATEDPTTFSTFLRCQQRLLVHVNILYPSYDILIGGGSQSRPEVSLFRQIHASLNSNLGRLLMISGTQQSVAANDPGSTSDLATGCEAEVVRTLHRLLLTWTTQESVNPADLASTTRLALRVRTIAEKEQILQGILYSIFTKVLRSYPSDELVVESRYAHLQKGRAVAVVLASTLRLYVWLHPSASSDQAWVAFESFLRLLVTADTPTIRRAPTDAPEAWATVIEVARENHPARYSCMGLGVLWLASRIEPGPESSQQIEEGRLLDWFSAAMRNVQEDGWVDHVPEELRGYWTTVERKCAGILFLEAWNATVDADGTGLPSLQLLNWTSSGTIEAFATWLHEFDGQETIEIKLEDVAVMQVTIRHSLRARFVEHATLANRQITEEVELQSILNKVPLANNDPRDDSNLAGCGCGDSDRDAMVGADMEGCEWCIDGARCMHRNPVSQS